MGVARLFTCEGCRKNFIYLCKTSPSNVTTRHKMKTSEIPQRLVGYLDLSALILQAEFWHQSIYRSEDLKFDATETAIHPIQRLPFHTRHPMHPTTNHTISFILKQLTPNSNRQFTNALQGGELLVTLFLMVLLMQKPFKYKSSMLVMIHTVRHYLVAMHCQADIGASNIQFKAMKTCFTSRKANYFYVKVQYHSHTLAHMH